MYNTMISVKAKVRIVFFCALFFVMNSPLIANEISSDQVNTANAIQTSSANASEPNKKTSPPSKYKIGWAAETKRRKFS